MSNTKKRILFTSILTLGILLRFVQLGAVPGGINQDEAFAAYEAYNLLEYSTDSWGYRLPVYFVAWGSGMNVLESYLMIPFIQSLGLSTLSIRLPQAIIASLSLVGFYLLLLKIFDDKTALLGMLILAVAPWHIMLSRWALESNLAPGLLIFAMLFFVKGLENHRFLILSALFYGLSLYAYAVMWLFVPVSLLLQIIYSARWGGLKLNLHSLTAAGLLFILALPLLLFLMVNYDIIPEINSFISIPKLPAFRGSDISLKNILRSDSWAGLGKILLGKGDGLLWNSPEGFGLYYYLSLPLTIIGLSRSAADAAFARRDGRFSLEALVILGLITAVFLGLCISGANVNRVNFIHFPVLIFTANGACAVWDALSGRARLLLPGIYLSALILFQVYYYSEYKEKIDDCFQRGAGECIELALESGKNVAVSDAISYSKILFYARLDPGEFHQSAVYENFPAPWLRPSSFSGIVYGIDYELDSDFVYVDSLDNEWFYLENGFSTFRSGGFIAALEE